MADQPDFTAPPALPWEAPSMGPVAPPAPIQAPMAAPMAPIASGPIPLLPPPQSAYPVPMLPTVAALPPYPALQKQTTGQAITRGVLATLAALAGPGSGTGMLQGVNIGDQQLQGQRVSDWQHQVQAIDRQQQEERLIAEEQRRQQDFAEQQRQHEERRAAMFMSNINDLRRSVGTLKDKAAYDNYVTAYATGMQGLGYRIDANALRQMVPFQSPKAEDVAASAIKRWLQNPFNEELIKQHPDQAMKATVLLDTDGDGVPERVPLSRAADIARMPFASDPATGAVMFSPKGTTPETSAGVNARFQDLLTVARSEGKDVDSDTPDAATLRNQIRDRAVADTSAARPRSSGTSPRQSRVDAQTAIRRELRGAMIGGAPPDDLARLSATMAGLGLDPASEQATIRKEFLGVGQRLQTPEERAAFGTPPTPEALIERGRRALAGGAVSPRPSTSAPGSAPALDLSKPPTPQEARASRDLGRRLIEDARRKAGDPRPVTDADVDELIKKPGNFDMLRRQSAAEASAPDASPDASTVAPGRYRWVPGVGLTPAPPVQ